MSLVGWFVGWLITRVICGQTVRDTVLDSTEVIQESAYGLSISTIKFDFGWPWGVKGQRRKRNPIIRNILKTATHMRFDHWEHLSLCVGPTGFRLARWRVKTQGYTFWREICYPAELYFRWPWEVKGQGHNFLIWYILKTVTDTRFDPRQHIGREKVYFPQYNKIYVGLNDSNKTK